MANTPNMALPISVVGQTTGPQWAFNVNAAFALVDAHNHANGSGVQINPSGLNINTNLSIGSNFLTNVAGVTCTPQSSTPADFTFYTKGVDAYFVDGNGNAIQMTSGGLVNATSSGISSGTASASFSGGVLVVLASSATPANIQGGSILLGNNTSGTKYLTLAPPAAMAANFALTLPTIPGATNFLSIDASGNIAAYAPVSGGLTGSNLAAGTITATQIAAGTITATQIATGTITATQIASETITATQIANKTITPEQVAENISSSGNNNASANSTAFVLAGSVTINTTGNSVDISMAPVLGSIGTDSAFYASGSVLILEILITMNTGGIASTIVGVAGSGLNYFAPSIANFTDLSAVGVSGNRVYDLYIRAAQGSGTVGVQNCVMIAREN